MSDNILERDVQVGLEMGWHGKTRVVEKVTKELALPFDYQRQPITINGTPWIVENNPWVSEDKLDETWDYLTCTDDNKPVGKPIASSFQFLGNDRFWEIVNNSLGGTGAVIESAGTVMNRTRRFITVKLNAENDEFKVGDRVFLNRFNFLDAIDGSLRFHAANTNICQVCWNTTQMFRFECQRKANRGEELAFLIKHTKNHETAIQNMEKVIDQTLGIRAQFKLALEQANQTKINSDKTEKVFAGFVIGELEDKEKPSTRGINTVNRLMEIFSDEKVGNRGETVLDMVSSVTDYYSHESSGGENKMRQWISSEFGSGRNKKRDFITTVIDADKEGVPRVNHTGINRLASIGEKVLA